jgi:6,7-dimethyl-8-ribityllumazine synthase
MRLANNHEDSYRHKSDTFQIAEVAKDQVAQLKIAIVVSRFNTDITSTLYNATYEKLIELGLESSNINTTWCPGAFEIPVIAKSLADTGKYDTIISLGAVIRGETWHFELVANQCAVGIMNAATATKVPIIFGVLATDNLQQAIERSSKDHFDTGSVAAESAVEMALKIKEITHQK